MNIFLPLANSAALLGKVNAYLVWGVDNESHDIIGTTFKPGSKKIGNEELESWLLRLLTPKINFSFDEIMIDHRRVVILEIKAAFRHPVRFKQQEFVRVGFLQEEIERLPGKRTLAVAGVRQSSFRKEYRQRSYNQ